MRGVFGLTFILVGAAMAWLIIIGDFPPHASTGANAPGTGILAVLRGASQANTGQQGTAPNGKGS